MDHNFISKTHVSYQKSVSRTNTEVIQGWACIGWNMFLQDHYINYLSEFYSYICHIHYICIYVIYVCDKYIWKECVLLLINIFNHGKGTCSILLRRKMTINLQETRKWFFRNGAIWEIGMSKPSIRTKGIKKVYPEAISSNKVNSKPERMPSWTIVFLIMDGE